MSTVRSTVKIILVILHIIAFNFRKIRIGEPLSIIKFIMMVPKAIIIGAPL